MKRLIIAMVAILAALTFPVIAGEWHTGNNNLCTDCHTMHFSQQHNWDGTTPVPTTPAGNGDWIGAVGSGPNNFLLKLPANQLCLGCHDGQTFAPDVMGVNANAGTSVVREAGALNETGLGGGYDTYKGHTLGSTDPPPGYNPAVVGLSPTWYDPAGGLECISCHTQHGMAGIYRNLGPRSLSASLPTYVIGTANDTTKDVWINIAAPYPVNSGNNNTFNPYYDFANVSFNRIDKTVGTTKTSNGIDTMCASCHGNFHGGPGDAGIGATAAALDGFIRHPTSQVTIGVAGGSTTAGGQGYGGHSTLTRYTAATTKVKVYASDRAAYTDASPGCVSCHKSHGNQNPFGLIFLNRAAVSVSEEGGYAAGQTAYNGTSASAKDGYRNLCGQCHGQGNN